MSLSEEAPWEFLCDAYPEDLDVAIALERFHEADGGLLLPSALGGPQGTFSTDPIPVVGFDEAPAFFPVRGARAATAGILRRRSLPGGKRPRGGASETDSEPAAKNRFGAVRRIKRRL